MQDFDSWWDYANPSATEQKFREHLAAVSETASTDYKAELLTQLARCNSLQRKFDEAMLLLSQAQDAISNRRSIAYVRYLLELGRTHNSNGNPQKAERFFTEAKNLSHILHSDFYTIDALHMLAIVAEPNEAIVINEEAIALAEKSQDAKAQGWLGSLYNNLGWAYVDHKRLDKALLIFLKAVDWRKANNQPRQTAIAQWCVGKVLRLMGKPKEALKIQRELWRQMLKEKRRDGFVAEELAECSLALKQVSQPYFSMAYDILREDEWLVKNEAARIERLRTLAQ